MEARPPAENRHGGAPRGERPASWDAPRLTRADPSRLANATTRQVRLSALRPPLQGDGREHRGRTRAQQRAAGTKNSALFDIVRKEHAASDGTIVSRASAARPGTQGHTSGCASRFLRWVSASRVYPTCVIHCRSRASPRSVSRSARARALATLARDTRPMHAANPLVPRRARSDARHHETAARCGKLKVVASHTLQ